MADSRRSKLDPRSLILDPVMQARDVELIKDKRLRSAQEIKQEDQDQNILEDLNNGLPIRQSITVFVVGDDYYVVDGFHRTGACLKYLKENPEADISIPAIVIDNRTYREAFSAAQDANIAHGVGVTSDEAMQSKFRKLIVNGNYNLSVSEVTTVVGCSRGQAGHIARGLKACGEILSQCNSGDDITETTGMTDLIEKLKDGLEVKWLLSSNCFDSKDFPKIRRLSNAITGNDLVPDLNADEWEQAQIQNAANDMSGLVDRYGEDFFREGLRKAARGSGLGVSISKRSKWLKQAGSVEGDESFGGDDPNDNGF
jgi:hypothetical protein